jgi:SNF2 family DNA or RNA helicase
LFITEYNYNSKHDWFVSSFLPLKLRLADFLSSPDIFSIRTSAPPAPEHPNASSNSDPLAHSIRFSYEPDDTARSRNYQLNVALKPYQQQTVEWMIAEENDPVGFHRHFYDLIQVVGKEHRTRHSIWISALLQDVCSKHDLPLCHGGVVCEEMGLGKTIEVIALIAANRVPRLPRNKLITHNGYIRHRSSATLVLVPPTLVGQWCDEFSKRHIGDLRLLKYYGPTRPHCPADLLQYDIVLTTFSVLVQEMKRPNSCFDLIYWHRVVVDEAHILKNTTTVQSRYIKKLRAKNKWCLTGTPISSSHAEIQGYLEFLGLAAAQSSQRWADKMTQPCRLSILNGLFMRYESSPDCCKYDSM